RGPRRPCAPPAGQSAAGEARKLVEFGNVDWESEMFFLDTLDRALRDQQDSTAHVVVYGGRRGDRRGEVQARMACIEDYMLNRRGLGEGRLTVVHGGFRETPAVELWLVPPGGRAPAAKPTVKEKDVRFRKGEIKDWRSRCNI
ncbi:MAG: hypothetical protein M3416_02100, partial [Acidobacteriota bacterium]|nr:hypothetical protein [Acidobacteriota bacterium]